jgi:hypothetical protein
VINIIEPTSIPEPDLEPCGTCSAGLSCVAHAPLFGELSDAPGRPAPATWGRTYAAPAIALEDC